MSYQNATFAPVEKTVKSGQRLVSATASNLRSILRGRVAEVVLEGVAEMLCPFIPQLERNYLDESFFPKQTLGLGKLRIPGAVGQ